MVYTIFKFIFGIALRIFYKKLFVNYNGILDRNEPTIFIANHPNSFFDAILLGVLLKQPIYSLTRGDVFKQKMALPILRAIRLIPIYRLKDGKETLSKNEATFKTCLQIFNKNGSVLIFGEAKCDGQYCLLPLQKGGIKIALQAWQSSHTAKNVRIVPVAISYSNLKGWRKVGAVIFGNAITKPLQTIIKEQEPFLITKIKATLVAFFELNLVQLKNTIITCSHKNYWEHIFLKNEPFAKNATTFVAAVTDNLSTIQQELQTVKKYSLINKGVKITHYPLFVFTTFITNKANTIGKVHYDSILLCVSLVTFMVYYSLVFTMFALIFNVGIGAWVLCILVALLLLNIKPFVLNK